jgi:hypothetical protein
VSKLPLRITKPLGVEEWHWKRPRHSLAGTHHDGKEAPPVNPTRVPGCSSGLVGAAACSTAETAAHGERYVELGSNKVTGGKGTVVVFMPETKQTREVWTGLSDELGDDFSLVAVKEQGPNSAAIIARAMLEHRPSGIVLMNNPTVLAYREYQHASGAGPFPPRSSS